MLRFLGVILLSVCVLTMPSYAAITCGATCVRPSAAHEGGGCCAAEPARATDAPDDAGGTPDDPKHPEDGQRPHCAAPCCGYIAHVLSGAPAHVEERPLAELLPPAAASHGSINHDAIFHPPRL